MDIKVLYLTNKQWYYFEEFIISIIYFIATYPLPEK